MTNLDNCEINEDLKMDHTLDIDMAYLDLDEKVLSQTSIQTESEPAIELAESEICNSIRRSKRKRIRPLDVENRRATTKPRKLDDSNYKETVSYYLDKRVKKLSSTLETIFEEPKSGVFMSGRRLKRFINFAETGLQKDKLKIKKRYLKAKKVHPIKNLKKKVSMDLLMKKLMSMEQAD